MIATDSATALKAAAFLIGGPMRTFFSFLPKQDRNLAVRLVDELRPLGYHPTISVDRHLKAHNWRSRLVEALRKSDVAVVLLSQAASKSPYVMGELMAARMLSQLNRRFVLVPVWLGPGDIPDVVRDLYVANGKGEDITDPKLVAQEIHEIVQDNLAFELEISDLTPRVFVGHGHSKDWECVADFLRNKLELEVEEYNERSPVGKTVQGRLEEMLTASSFAIIVMSAEDEIDGSLRARQNVIHEVGLFQGRLGFEKVIVLRQLSCEAFSNISGLNEVRYDSSSWDKAFEGIRLALEREGIIGKLPEHPGGRLEARGLIGGRKPRVR